MKERLRLSMQKAGQLEARKKRVKKAPLSMLVIDQVDGEEDLLEVISDVGLIGQS